MKTHLRKPIKPIINTPNRLLKRLLKRPPNRHNLPHTLHTTTQHPTHPTKLLQIPPRDLHHTIIQGRLKTRRRHLRHAVLDLVERDPQTELRGDEGERVARGFRGEGGRAREAGVDFDDAVLLRGGVERVLDVALAYDAEVADDVHGGRAEHVVVRVGEGLRGRDDDGVSRMDAQGVEVLSVRQNHHTET